GGINENGTLATVEVYDPSAQQWSSVARLISETSFLAAATGSDGRIYAIGGCQFTDNCGPDYLAQAYDPHTDAWVRLKDMASGRALPAGPAASDGRSYAIGGLDDSGQIVGSVRAYDPLTDTWSEVAALPTLRMGLAAAVGRAGTIYALGGNNGTSTFLDTAEA